MMKKPLLIAAALSLAAAGGTAALAQNAAPSATPQVTTDNATAPAPRHPGGHEMGMRWGHHHHGEHDRGKHGRPMMFTPGTFALFAPQPDKNLSVADVQQIAQSILLWNGNHDWKVAQVQPGQNHQVTFAYTAQDGTVIAKFAINQNTGHIARVG